MRTVSRRLDYVDVMKGIAIFLVVAGHVLAGCKSESMSGWNVMVLWNFIYEFHMPLFMFISGFVCFNPSKQYTWVMMVKRCISYLIPFFMGGLLIGIMRQNMDIEILWYFRTLCVLAVTLFVSIKLCSVIFGKIRLQVVYVALVAIVYFIMIQMLCALCERFSFCDLIIDSGHFQWLYIYLFFLLGWLLRALPMLDIYVRNDYMLVLSFAGVLILSVFEFPLSSLFKIACLITFVLNISSIPKMKECKYLLNLGG